MKAATGAVLALMIGVAAGGGPVTAQDLVAVAVSGDFRQAGSEAGIYTWSASTGWSSEPIVGGPALPHIQGSAFGLTGSVTSGGAGCQVHVGDEQAVTACAAGVCAAAPSTSLAAGTAAPEATAADERYVFVASGTAAGLRLSRADTLSGAVDDFEVSLSRPQVGDVHDIVIDGDFLDIVVRFRPANSDVTDVVSLRKDGTVERVFQLGSVIVSSADLNPDSGLFYTIERPTAGGGWRVAEYDNDWQRLRSVTAPNTVAPFEEALAVVDGEIVTFEAAGGVARFSLQGARIAALNPPPGTNLISHLHTRYCVPDDTRAFLGPDGRLEVTGEVTDFQGNVLPMRFPPRDSRDSTQTYVFDPANREGLFKALDACAINDRIWFFGALATTTRFTVTVRDRMTGATATFNNPRGNRAVAIEDTASFPCS